MKSKKQHTDRTGKKQHTDRTEKNSTLTEQGKNPTENPQKEAKSILLTQIQDHSLSWLRTCISIKSDGAELCIQNMIGLKM